VVNRDVVVVGASAGGVEALLALVAGLPADLPATVLVVLHLPAGGTSALPAILARAGRLPVSSATQGAPLRHGQVYTAPTDCHLLVADGALALSTGPTENGHRPAVNALFRSAAQALGPRCLGVVLSGALDDGAAGLGSIAARGGGTVVQAPDDALYPGMPEAALREVPGCRVLPAREMGAALAELVRWDVGPERVAERNPLTAVEVEGAEHGDGQAGHGTDPLGVPPEFSCPDCQGALIALRETRRYRCRVGHAWTEEALLQRKHDDLERALWTALRTLDERTTLAKRMRGNADQRHNPALAERYRNAATESEQAATTLRSFLHSGFVRGEREG
jgi:two-component system chemotaxis response regulator CheB